MDGMFVVDGVIDSNSLINRYLEVIRIALVKKADEIERLAITTIRCSLHTVSFEGVYARVGSRDILRQVASPVIEQPAFHRETVNMTDCDRFRDTFPKVLSQYSGVTKRMGFSVEIVGIGLDGREIVLLPASRLQ